MQVDLIYIKTPNVSETIPSGMAVLRPDDIPFEKVDEIAQQASERARTLLPTLLPVSVLGIVETSLRKAGYTVISYGFIKVELE